MIRSTLILAGILSTSALAAAANLLTRAQGVVIAEKTARENSIDLAIYRLLPFNKREPFNVSVEKENEWEFVYRCNGAGPPGCEFIVVVDRVTGKARFIPGL